MTELLLAYRNRGLATPFTFDVLGRAGVSASLIPRTLQSLRLLDLIDENGNPTPELEGLRRAGEAEYPQRLEAVVRTAYAEVFQFVDPAEDDVGKVRDAFRAYEPIGQLARMVTLFMGLCAAAGIIQKAPTRKRTPSRSSGIGPPITKKNSGRGAASKESDQNIPAPIRGLLASLPNDGATWTQEQRDHFVSTFTTVLDFVVPIRKPSAVVPDDE